PKCAAGLAKYRINPGNVGAKRRDEHFRTIVEVALANEKPVRIGVNWGSLDQQLLTEMMDANARRPDPLDAREVMLEAMVASATPGRGPDGGGARRAAGAAVARTAALRAPGLGLSRVRAHHVHVLSGNGGADSGAPEAADARVARPLSGGGDAARCGDGVRRERPRRVEARGHRHLAARHVRGAEGTGVRGRPPQGNPQGRND